MALIEFTKIHTDHSTDKGYQFEFFCDRCGSGYRSEFRASVTGMAGSVLRAAGNLFGGILGSAGGGAYEIERAVQGPGRDKAFREAIEEAKPHFRKCPKCSQWACLATCWNEKRGLCHDCAPNLETEIAAAQATATVEQAKKKIEEQDLTKGIDLETETTALCPHCGARSQGGKFCGECGKPMRAKATCGRCGTEAEAGTKFCPECGAKLG